MEDAHARLLAQVIGSAARGIIKAIALHSMAVTVAPPTMADYEKIINDEGLGWNDIAGVRLG